MKDETLEAIGGARNGVMKAELAMKRGDANRAMAELEIAEANIAYLKRQVNDR